MFRKFILIIFCGAGAFSAVAQEENGEEESRVGSSILNDTTENLYGPQTTEYFFYKDILHNTGNRYKIDTSVYDLHQFNFVDFHDKHYQDLGNIGTAIAPIFYEFPETVGRTTGFKVYDLYFEDASKIRFFDTRSPYSRLGVIIGGQGRSITEVAFSRNINPYSNIGFNYRGLFMDKQVERARRGDRNVQGIYYNFHANFRTKDGKYQALGAFVRNNQQVDEYGGIRDTSPETPLKLFYEDTIKVSMGNTDARDLRREYFLYHEYHLTSIIELFHEFRHYDQMMGLKSIYNSDPDSAFFPRRVITEEELVRYGGNNRNVIDDWNKFDEWSNKIGIAGSVGDGYYQAYYQRRNLVFDYRFMDDQLTDTLGLLPSLQGENMAGVMLRIGTEESMQLAGNFDYAEGGYYNMFGRLALRPFYVSLRQMRRKPSYVESAYRSYLNDWYLIPEAPVVSEGDAGVFFDRQNLYINAGVKAMRLTNHIYFTKEGRSSRAIQNNGTITALTPYVNFAKWWGKHWLTTGEAIYSMVGGDNPEVYPLPEWFANFQFSYNNIHFDGNLEWQTGFDVHWKSPYYARGYDPLVQQFYVQHDFVVPGLPLIDVFLNAKINRGRVFVKYTNVYQLLKGYGYFPTPYYPGQLATFDFGFNWSFYD